MISEVESGIGVFWSHSTAIAVPERSTNKVVRRVFMESFVSYSNDWFPALKSLCLLDLRSNRAAVNDGIWEFPICNLYLFLNLDVGNAINMVRFLFINLNGATFIELVFIQKFFNKLLIFQNFNLVSRTQINGRSSLRHQQHNKRNRKNFFHARMYK
jgi:hypothetical protein